MQKEEKMGTTLTNLLESPNSLILFIFRGKGAYLVDNED